MIRLHHTRPAALVAGVARINRSVMLAALTIALMAGVAACDQSPLEPDGATLSATNAESFAKGKPVTPPGTIYAILDGVGYKMDGDGDNRIQIQLPTDGWGRAIAGEPSRELHPLGAESIRWFLSIDILGECNDFDPAATFCYPDSTRREAIFARSETGITVQLTSDDTFFHPTGHTQAGFRWSWEAATGASRFPRWSKNPADATIVFDGRRFDPVTRQVVEAGVYEANVAFVGGIPSLGMPSLLISANLVVGSECTTDGICQTFGDVERGDWSPDGSKLAYDVLDFDSGRGTVHVFDQATGSRTNLGATGRGCRWSEEDVILFKDTPTSTEETIASINLDGSGLTTLVKARDQDKGATFSERILYAWDWSPDGNHFVYELLVCNGFPCSGTLIRRKANGKGVNNLTKDADIAYPLGWR